MILEPKYIFKYYPYRGLRLARVDPIKGNIIGYVDDYREYAAALKGDPRLKKHYDSTNPSDRKKMIDSLARLSEYQYSHTAMIHEAMKLGVLREDIEKLIENKHKLITIVKKKPSSIIDLSTVPTTHQSIFNERPESAYIDARPEYLSLEERRKRKKKTKMKRKVNRCKCKK